MLWTIWDASGLAPQWQRESAAGGAAGAAADRDLDAVLALFDKAAHFADTMPPGSPGLFADSLAGQEIVGDTLAERAVRDNCVRVLTAHRSKGLEWDVVVVAGVQEETWPDLRLRGSVLGAGELAEAAYLGGQSAKAQGADVDAAILAAKLLAEERRLFYVAVTRARRLLVVTAAGGEDSDLRPSRFLTELAGDDVPIERIGGGHGAHRWLSMPALVADLRRAAAETGRPLPVRQAAAAELARLAAAGVRAAHPRDWYALTELSDASAIVAGGEAVRLSPSQVESFTRCGLRWLLEAAVGAGRSDVLRHLGTVIHAAAVLAATGATEQQVADRIDEIWHHLDFGSAWYSAKQRSLAERMVRKFLDWHAANPRALVAVEQSLKVRIGQVEITGRVDRLEADDRGRAVVVDLKTGASAPREEELGRHPQLGVYQLAVLLGAFEHFGLSEPGGAELVQVGKAGLTARAKVQRQDALADDLSRAGPRTWWRPSRPASPARSSPRGSTPAAAPARSPHAARSTPRASRSRAEGPQDGPGRRAVGTVQLDRQADHLVTAAGDGREIESLDDPDTRFQQDAVDQGPIGAVTADGQVIHPDGPHPGLGQMHRGRLRDVHEIFDETCGLPAAGRVQGPEQDAFARPEPVFGEFSGRDLGGVLDLDHPGLAHRRGQRHLIQPGRLMDEVHRPVHMGASVHPHGEVGDVARVATAEVHDPFQHDRRVIRPMRHAAPDRH